MTDEYKNIHHDQTWSNMSVIISAWIEENTLIWCLLTACLLTSIWISDSLNFSLIYSKRETTQHISRVRFLETTPISVGYTLGAETFASRNFRQICESLRREKFYIDRFAKVYACEIIQFFLFFSKLVGCPW